jgi:hypothetical protein
VPPLTGSQDITERALEPDRNRNPQQIYQEQHRSERRDRSFVHRALRRGVPAQEIEDRLLAATEFHRLNPERDPIAYVRGLIDEDDGGLRSLEVGNTRVAELSANSSSTRQPASHQYATQSEIAARRYIQENFEATDWLAVVVRNRSAGETVQRITTAQQIASPEFQSWLRHKNANGSDIYLSLNTVKEHAHGRTKADVKEIRHLYLDLDEEGQRKVAGIYENPALPRPNYVLETSPEKYQVIWRVQAIGQNQAEDLLRGLAQQFGGDPAATDATRVFRLPGFSNRKYEQGFWVKVVPGASAEPVYHRADFKVDSIPRGSGSRARARTPAASNVHSESPGSQSERDWAYAIRHLERGDAPEDIVREITLYRTKDRPDPQDPTTPSAKKPNPRYYAEHTVGQAMAHLGMADSRGEQAPDRGESTSPEIELDR